MIAPGLADGMAYAYATRVCARYQALACELDKLATVGDAVPGGTALPRPTSAAQLELHTFQSLDATLVGAFLRDAAGGGRSQCRRG